MSHPSAARYFVDYVSRSTMMQTSHSSRNRGDHAPKAISCDGTVGRAWTRGFRSPRAARVHHLDMVILAPMRRISACNESYAHL